MMHRRVVCFVLIVVSLICGCQSKDTPQLVTKVGVTVRTPAGDALSEAVVQAGKQRTTTGVDGRAQLALTPSHTEELFVACPAGYSGGPLERRISSVLLQAGAELSYELMCSPLTFDFALAVKSDGCDELRLSLNGADLGQSEVGLLHHLVVATKQEFLELRAEPADANCTLDEPQQMVKVDSLVPGAWVRFSGKRLGSKPPATRATKSAKVVPYRL